MPSSDPRLPASPTPATGATLAPAKASGPSEPTPGATERSPAAPVACEDGVSRPAWAARPGLLRDYYDDEWGIPQHNERAVFEHLALEGFQSGLSWSTILAKRPAFRRAFAGFDPEVVARFDEADVGRLLDDPGIVRNRRKIEATIVNARCTVALRPTGGLAALVWSFAPAPEGSWPEGAGRDPAVETTSPESRALSQALKALGFRFVGPTTMHALLQAIGIFPVRTSPTTSAAAL